MSRFSKVIIVGDSMMRHIIGSLNVYMRKDLGYGAVTDWNFSPDERYTISSHSSQDRSFEHLIRRLDALMLVLKECKAEECRNPWGVLHPRGDVRTLKDSLSAEFDSFYSSQPNVPLDSCGLGCIRKKEGPLKANAYEAWAKGISQDIEFVHQD